MCDLREDLDDAAHVAPPADSHGSAAKPNPATPHVGSHEGIFVNQTRGHHPRVWCRLFWLLVDRQFIAVAADHRLLPDDAVELADWMIWPTAMIQEALRWLVKHDLVVIRMRAGKQVACPDLGALRALIRQQQDLERAGRRGQELTAFAYFRARHLCTRLEWMRFVLGEESVGAPAEADDA